ncbi:MAG: hypothetical protein ACJ0Q8_06855 [Candidatus Azotimanducaceae bacterium]
MCISTAPISDLWGRHPTTRRFRRLIAKLVGGVVALLLVIVLPQGVASETCEVVVLTTLDQTTGAPLTPRLWIVDHQSPMWLRGDASSG